MAVVEQARIQQILIAIALVAAEAAMLAAIWDLPKSVLFLSAILQLAAAGSLYFYADLPHVNLGWVFFSICLAINLAIVGSGIYGRLSNDPRLAPFAENSRFFDALPTNEPGTFTMLCYPFDVGNPSSCNIALRYQDELGKYWRPGEFVFDQRRPNFTGVSILTQSKDPSNAALKMREHFRSIGIEPIFDTADPSLLKLGPDDFALWIGGKP